ncbi:hypothetical protein EMIHUDRAFT_252871 [Emiliania huxleyi CCMP1516]|uniref:Uncharacterized protein n=2 Tax=Emiliania huxleyi TaxID=2903 RepID=A0A0D3KFH9_EMIH1|nr:hypothetical protein EMIHUDRAFT_252871 [Emiliania huxleyi CCMP1516]EOD34514.1 hypothetical protein EMIHUDRAFT_252871 [Emiliania huxleyi CCMP1516]|eukprot:XP_005786943.1 hypothetical protein EMIHUDRAFT_252871 [Emiliania huxleyi CCMP1516]
MPNPLLFVGKGAALTAAARAADKANEGGGAFQRLGEGRGAAIRLAWPAEALHTVPHERRAAAGDADDPFAHGRPITKRARRAAGELRAVQHQERAEAPREAELAAAEERTAEQAALLAPLAATDTTARLAKRRRSALVAAVLHQPIAEPAGRAAQMLAPLGEHLKRQCDELDTKSPPAHSCGKKNRNDVLLLHLAAAPSVLAVYATATACGIALVQLGDAGPSAGLIQCERTFQASGAARRAEFAWFCSS